MRRSASYEPLGKESSTSSEGDIRKGTKHGSASAILSPTSNSRQVDRQTASDDGTPKSSISSTFLLGSTIDDDDVFTQEADDRSKTSLPSKEDTQVQVYGDSSPAKVDAQGIYPGTACMFVANLSQPYDDQTLEYEVTKHFSQFGKVWVKIKRDSNQMPFAFCQFTNDEDAQNAEKLGKGALILGRPCRTEMARAHSSFIVHKISGEPIHKIEAWELLGKLGAVAKAEYLSEDAQTLLGIPRAVLVTYKMYDPKREPVRHFSQDKTYRVICNDPKQASGPRDLMTPATKHDGDRQLLEQYDRDRRSSFIGNLPLSMTEEMLRSIASGCGEVVNVQLYKKLIPGGNGQKHCFGFVEYVRPDASDDLVTSMNNADIDGYRIRVERKHSKTFETPTRAMPPRGTLRHVRSTIPRRRTSGFFGTHPSSMVVTASPTGHHNSGNALGYGHNTFSHERGRHTRPTIFNPGTSVSQALASSSDIIRVLDNVDPTEAKVPTLARHKSLSSISSPKKSVEFDLARDRGKHMKTPPSAEAVPINSDNSAIDPKTPRDETSATDHASTEGDFSPSRREATMAVQPQMAWMPTYTPYGYPYMGGPMTPQGGPGVMYGSYMGPQYYTPMCDIFGNVIVSPTPMMSPYGQTPVPQDPTSRSQDDTSQTRGSD